MRSGLHWGGRDPTDPLALINGLRSQIYNWWFAGPIAWLIMRCPPRRFLSRTPLAKLILTLRLRSGSTIRCRVDEFIAFVEIFVLNDYDIPGLEWQFVNSVVDVGANVGIATVWFAERAKHARILAVEPSPVALPILQSNVDRNGLKGRVSVVRLALGGSIGFGYLSSSGPSVETQVTTSSSLQGGAEQRVPVTTLGQLLQDWQLSSVNVLKLNCEGAEYEVLLTADSILLGRIGAIVGEYHQFGGREPNDVKSHLERCGFDVRLCPHPKDRHLGTFIARSRPG